MTARLMVLTAALIGAAAGIRAHASMESIPPRQALSEIPLQLGDWTGVDGPALDAGTVAVLAADEYVSRLYARRPGDVAQLFMAYYGSQRQGSAMHSPMNCLPGAGWQAISTGRLAIAREGAPPLEVNRYVVQKGLDRQLVLYWYQSHGRVIASEYWSKVYLVLDGIRTGRTDAALVRVMTPLRLGESRAEAGAVSLARELSARLARHLPE